MNWLRNVSIYTFCGLLTAGIPFLILPVLTHYLMPEDYAVISLFNALERFLLAFITFGIVEMVGVEFFKQEAVGYRSYVTTAIVFSLAVTLSAMLLNLILPPPVAEWLNIPKNWVYLAPLCGFLFFIFSVNQMVIRSQKRAATYGAFSIGATALEVLTTLLFVVVMGMSWQGRLLSHTFAGLAVAGASLLYLNFNAVIGPAFSMENVKKIVRVGLPLIPTNLSVFALELSDRYFIAKLVDLKETGIYSIGSQIGMVTFIFLNACAITFFPKIYETLKSGDPAQRRNVVKLTYGVLLTLLVSVFILSFVLAPLIFKYLINEQYGEGLKYVFWISLGYFFLGFQVFFKVYCLYHGKTKYLAWSSITAVTVNLALNYVLISKYGAMGAAYTTVISYAVAGAMVVYFAVKTEKMPWFLR